MTTMSQGTKTQLSALSMAIMTGITNQVVLASALSEAAGAKLDFQRNHALTLSKEFKKNHLWCLTRNG